MADDPIDPVLCPPRGLPCCILWLTVLDLSQASFIGLVVLVLLLRGICLRCCRHIYRGLRPCVGLYGQFRAKVLSGASTYCKVLRLIASLLTMMQPLIACRCRVVDLFESTDGGVDCFYNVACTVPVKPLGFFYISLELRHVGDKYWAEEGTWYVAMGVYAEYRTGFLL